LGQENKQQLGTTESAEGREGRVFMASRESRGGSGDKPRAFMQGDPETAVRAPEEPRALARVCWHCRQRTSHVGGGLAGLGWAAAASPTAARQGCRAKGAGGGGPNEETTSDGICRRTHLEVSGRLHQRRDESGEGERATGKYQCLGGCCQEGGGDGFSLRRTEKRPEDTQGVTLTLTE